MYFSVIVPVYNVEEFISQCIESILMQSCMDMELLLINDGSTDKSRIICDEYSKKDNRVKVINQVNGGVSEARNRGLHEAKGKYILFVDGDDYWSSNILGDIKEKIFLAKEPDFIFAYNETILHPKRNEIFINRKSFSKEYNSTNGELTLEHILTKTEENLFSIWRGIFKRTVIEENSIFFDKGVTIGEDADWLFRFVMHSKNTILFEMPFYVYRINRAGSAMSTISKKGLSSYLSIVKKWIDSYNRNPSLIGQIICNKLSNNYVDYFKYISFHDDDYANQLVNEIQDINLLSFVNSHRALKIKNEIEKKGYRKILKILNCKWRLRLKTKIILVKLKLLK